MSADASIMRFLTCSMERLPTAAEFVKLCGELQIGFAVVEGQPVMKAPKQHRDVAELIAKLIRREPWRSQVIELAKLEIAPHCANGTKQPAVPDREDEALVTR